MERLLRRVLAVLFLANCAFFFSTANTAIAPHMMLSCRAKPMPTSPLAPLLPKQGGTALNWSGYIATGTSYTAVHGEWTVPPVTNFDGQSADATWVGVGGAVTNDLLQAGTEALPSYTDGIAYRAWLEALPGKSIPLPIAVSPGDTVSVSLSREDGTHWLVTFANQTSGRSYETEITYTSSFSSAEWIEELPTATDAAVALDHFGLVRFADGGARVNGRAETIAQTNAQPVRMVNAAGEDIAVPSRLSKDGRGFDVVRGSANSEPLTCGADCGM